MGHPYAVLSDPNSRWAYDAEAGGLLQGKMAPKSVRDAAAARAGAEAGAIGQQVPAQTAPPVGQQPVQQPVTTFPGDTDGDGRISPQESVAAQGNPAVLGQMIDHPNAQQMMQQQYQSDPGFRAKINKIRNLSKIPRMRSVVIDGITKELGVSQAHAGKLYNIANSLQV